MVIALPANPKKPKPANPMQMRAKEPPLTTVMQKRIMNIDDMAKLILATSSARPNRLVARLRTTAPPNPTNKLTIAAMVDSSKNAFNLKCLLKKNDLAYQRLCVFTVNFLCRIFAWTVKV